MSITPESIQTLLNSADLGDRLRAINHMRTLEPAIAFQLVQPAVTDSNARVRYAAVSLLASVGNQDLEVAMNLLRTGLQDPEPDVQAAAADSISALKLTDAFDDLQSLYIITPEWLVKFSIVAALGELGDQRGFEILKDAINEPNELMQMAAIGSLGELGNPQAVDLLAQYVENPDWQVRFRVAQALKSLNTSTAQPFLEKLAADSVEQVAEEAKAGLG